MLNRMMTAGFKNIKKSNDIGINIRTGMVDTVAYSRLGSQIDDNIRLERFKLFVHRIRISQVSFYKGKSRIVF